MKELIITLLTIALTSMVSAQTINSSDVSPIVGDNFSYHNTDYLSPGNSGAGQIWDLSLMSSNDLVSVSYTNSSFVNANTTQTYSTGQVFEWDYNSSGQDLIAQIAQGVTVEYSNPWTYFGFPLNMGVSGSDTFYSTFTSSGTIFIRSGTTTWEVDGTGTLITPAGTYTDVIRVKTIDEYSDDSSFGTIYYEGEAYIYLKAGFRHPLATLSTIENSFTGLVSFGTYLDGTASITLNNELVFNLYPNPTSDFLTISTSGNTEFDKIEIIDLNGKVLVESTSNKIDVSHLNVGMYMVVLTGKNQEAISKQKFLKK